MSHLTSTDIRKRFLAFFEKRGHAILPSASLLPENDPSVLFTTAGMQPLVPYLLGEKHPQGKRLANIQKCVRTGDIEETGDNTHLTFFEMMGNWSLGDYFKAEAIQWSFEFLTSTEEGLGLDPRRLYVTCFEGDADAPKDTESAEIWRGLFTKAGVSGERIYFLPKKNNWWSPGDNGPCGPDTEMFYDLSGTHLDGLTLDEYLAADEKQEVVEIWNDVFMQYLKKDGAVVGELQNKNVDTGSGLERVTAVLAGVDNVFDTDLFASIMAVAKTLAVEKKSQRVLSDHMRTAVFMINDGVLPSNTDQGYVLRRLIRRSVMHTDTTHIADEKLAELVSAVVETYAQVYPALTLKKEHAIETIRAEQEKFAKTLKGGLAQFEKILGKQGDTRVVSGADAFLLFSTYGFPVELVSELSLQKGFTVDIEAFKKEFSEHQEKSKAGAEQKFKGGLADHSDAVVRYHTATHLLHQALVQVLGPGVAQKGSNITSERLRFDFTYPQKMTTEEIRKVEEIVNSKIQAALPVQQVVLPKEEALASGAKHLFDEKYGDTVSVYFIGDSLETAYSKEFCGGPHVANTAELGTFTITKEEAVAAGVRRIKAVLS